jgi:hypothetical protein
MRGWRLSWPAAAGFEAGLLLALALGLREQGRLWLCRCGTVRAWSGDIWSNENSQQLADPYSFTHLTHGVLFYWLLRWVWPRASVGARLVVATVIEVAWELAENSEAVINRYREATISLDYFGDTVLNSTGDVAFCVLGFLFAWKVSGRIAALYVVASEAVLAVLIRDGLILNVLMLVHPIEAIRRWQSGA